jgi:hypothetical protein
MGENRLPNDRRDTLAKDSGMIAPQCALTSSTYEKDCREALSPYVADLLAKAEAAGWTRTGAASALMYLAAMELKQR